MGILITNRSITRRRFTTMVDNNLICSQCSSRFISDHRPRSHPMITLTLSFCPFFVRNGITIVRWNDLQEDSWDGSCPQAEEPPEDSEVGRQGVQEEPSWERVEEALPGLFPRQGHRPGEDRHRGQAAQLGHPEVRPGAADQERQEDRRLRAQRRLLELHRGERRSADRRVRAEGARRRRYPRSQVQGGQGLGGLSAGALQGEEGEAEVLKGVSFSPPLLLFLASSVFSIG